MGGGLEADLSAGAVRELWYGAATSSTAAGYEPVLQVADVAFRQYRCCRLLLSDGVHSQHAMLAPQLTHLASGGDRLRRGSVVRLVHFYRAISSVPGQDSGRTISIDKLEILQIECALIGSLKFYEPTRNSRVSGTSRSMSYGLRSDCEPCFGLSRMGTFCGSYPSGGGKLSSVALLEKPPVWKRVADIRDGNLGYSDKPDLITVKATISCVTELLCHAVCPLMVNGKQCNGKATGDVDRTWRCNKCRYCFFEPCNYGCSVRIKIQDHTGTASATAKEGAVEEILGCRAEDLYSYKEHNHTQLDDIILGAVGKQFVFQLKVEQKLSSSKKCIVLKAEKVDPSAESRRLLGRINTLMQEEGSWPGLGGLKQNVLSNTAYNAAIHHQQQNLQRRSQGPGSVWFTA